MLSPLKGALRRAVYFTPDYDRDIVLASYPRSGNTWTRAMLYAVLNDGRAPRSIGDIDSVVPDGHVRHPRRKMAPRDFYVVKTHEPLRADAVPQRAIYVVRDPLEVLMSYYGFIKNSSPTLDLQRFARSWLAGRIWPCSWREHVESWLWLNRSVDIHLVNYSELRLEPAPTLQRMAAFIGCPIGTEAAEAIVSATSMESMMAMESNGMGRQTAKKLIRTSEGSATPDVVDLVNERLGAVWETVSTPRDSHQGHWSHPPAPAIGQPVALTI